MAGEFGDLIGFDFGGFGGGDTNLDVGTTMPTPAPSAGGGFSFGDLAQGAKDVGGAIGKGVSGVLEPVSSVAKPLLPLAGLATAGMGIASGVQGAKQAAAQNRLARQAQQMQQQSASATQAAAAPLTQFGEQQLQAAQQGQVPAAIQARIQEWKQAAMAAANDYMARSGQGNSQAREQWLAYIEKQAKAMEASYLQEEERLGLQGLTQGAQTLASAGGQAGNVAASATGQRSAIDDLMKQSNDVLARLTASAA